MAQSINLCAFHSEIVPEQNPMIDLNDEIVTNVSFIIRAIPPEKKL